MKIKSTSQIPTIDNATVWAVFTFDGDGFAEEVDISVAQAGVIAIFDEDDIVIVCIINRGLYSGVILLNAQKPADMQQDRDIYWAVEGIRVKYGYNAIIVARGKRVYVHR